MRISLFVSLIWFLSLAGSLPSPAQNAGTSIPSDTSKLWEPLFGDDFQKGLYRTTLDISKNHLSGYIFIKKVADTSTRILFSNDFGMQIFDFEFHNKEFTVHYCFPSLERKSLINLLESDFRILLFSNEDIRKIKHDKSGTSEELSLKIISESGKWHYRISANTRKILAIKSLGKFISKTRIDLDQSNDSLTGIKISNPLIKLKIRMRLIDR